MWVKLTLDPLERLADAAERIATALENQYANKASQAQLRVSSTGNRGRAGALLRTPELIWIHLHNEGGAPAILHEPLLTVESVMIQGTVGANSRSTSARLPLGPGEECVLSFKIETNIEGLEHKTLYLRVPHESGQGRPLMDYADDLHPAGNANRVAWAPINPRIEIARGVVA